MPLLDRTKISIYQAIGKISAHQNHKPLRSIRSSVEKDRLRPLRAVVQVRYKGDIEMSMSGVGVNTMNVMGGIQTGKRKVSALLLQHFKAADYPRGLNSLSAARVSVLADISETVQSQKSFLLAAIMEIRVLPFFSSFFFFLP